MQISNHAVTPVATYPQQVQKGDIQPSMLEAAALDPETRSRLLQLGHPMRNAARAAATRAALVVQLKEQGLGTAGPPHTEVLADPAALEEFNRKKQKESTLASSLGVALEDSLRTQAELKKSLIFLLPKIAPGLMRDEERAAGEPDAEPFMQNPADTDVGGLVWNSHGEFFAQISALLEVLKSEWLSKYQETLATFLEFYKEFSDIMEGLKPSASGDKGDVKINFTKVFGELKALAQKYGKDSSAFASFPSMDAAVAFRDSLGLPGLVVDGPGTDGLYYVKMDLSSVESLMYHMKNPNHEVPEKDGVVMDSAQYNAWVSQKDSNMEQIKHVSKVLGEKLNEMTQKYDNIVKILSSSIDKMSEANKAYVHNT